MIAPVVGLINSPVGSGGVTAQVRAGVPPVAVTGVTFADVPTKSDKVG